MAKTRFPKTAAGFNTWLTQFHKTFNANYKAWGFTQKDLRSFNHWYKAWGQSYMAWTQFQAFQTSFSKFHNAQWQSFQGMIEGFCTQITKSSKWNGNWQYWFGSTAKNTTVVKSTAQKSAAKKIKKPVAKKASVKVASTKIAAKKTPMRPKSAATTIKSARTSPRAATKTIAKIVKKAPSKPIAKKTTAPTSNGMISKNGSTSNAPFVWFTSGSRKGSVNVYVGYSKNTGFGPGKMSGTAYVEYRTGSGRWVKLTQGSNFPFVHTVPGSKTVYYRACWVTNGKKGAWGRSVSYTFGAKAAA